MYSRAVGPFLIATTALSFASMFAQTGKWRFYFLASRYWEFGLGALVAVYDRPAFPVPMPVLHRLLGSWARWEHKRAALIALYAAAWAALIVATILTPSESYPNALTLPVCVATALVIACKMELRVPVLKQIGDLSYSVYLYHWPIIILCRHYMGVSMSAKPAWLASLVLTAMFSSASYWLIDKWLWGQAPWESDYKRYARQWIEKSNCTVILVDNPIKVLPSLDIGWMRSLLSEHPELRGRVEMVSFNDLVCWDSILESLVGAQAKMDHTYGPPTPPQKIL
eukprot:m51a1_g13265 hypothetical protein (282) ;mRNA; f:26-1895